MKRFVLLVVFIIAGFAFAAWTPPDSGTSPEDTLSGLTTNIVIYGSLSDGTGIVTNSLTYTNGLLMVFP